MGSIFTAMDFAYLVSDFTGNKAVNAMKKMMQIGQ